MRFLFLFFLLLGASCVSGQIKFDHVEMPDVLMTSVENQMTFIFNEIPDSLKSEIKILVGDKVVIPVWEESKAIVSVVIEDEALVEVNLKNENLFKQNVEPIPLWVSILPPLIAIIMALLTKEVFSALFLGLLVGTTIIWKYKGFSLFISIFKGLFANVDTYALAALNHPDHLSIIIFSMLIGGMVTLITMNGGMKGVVDILSGYAKSPRSGQIITWLMGLMIFFDDYANTLVVGNTMRPITDKLKISREKLAYIVDSTSAPIASVAFITTWIGAELSYINTGIDHLGLNESAYQVFLHSLKYSFYPIFTLVFGLLIIFKERDFGPMYKAEIKARKRKKDQKYGDSSHLPQITRELEVVSKAKGRWYNAFVPVFIVVVGTIVGLMYTGWDSEVWHDASVSFGGKLSVIIGNADSFKALIWSSLLGVLAALLMSTLQKVLLLKEAIEGLVNGFKTMFSAVLILVLAWSIALITEHFHTADFITYSLKVIKISPYWVPALAFVFSSLIAFSTGSSWGTMAIIYPLILPASWKISMEFGFDAEKALPIFYNVVSTVLAGSVLGDHCSPISDTTILSSLASSCNHVNHVRTQLPYALVVGLVSLLVGTIPGAFGMPFWVTLLLGAGLLYVIVMKLGKKVVV